VIRNWRAWVLLTLLVGPILAYMGFGAYWLYQRGWVVWAGSIWVTTGVIFGVLADRWTKSSRKFLPPIDWEAPQTFAKVDRDAWVLVEQEAELGEAVPMEDLVGFDVYVETGRRLARKLADHYHPLSTDPVDNIPVVDLLTALELAAEDLRHLCRQVPGGDLLTPSHWKRAVQVSGYITRANDIYSYLLPIFSPVTGLARLGAQQWMVKPAWKNMQQNLLRWFFRAYVNRLGLHLIELNSGRLAIGAAQYRQLTRRGVGVTKDAQAELPPLRIAVAGARRSGKSRLIGLAENGRYEHLSRLKARAMGVDEAGVERLRTAEWFEVPGYTASAGPEAARDRATRREAVAKAVESDVLVLLSDVSAGTVKADAAFARDWDQYFSEHADLERPPALVVAVGLDSPGLAGDWSPPHDWESGQSTRETAGREALSALREALPADFATVVPAGITAEPPFGIAEGLFPALIADSPRTERATLIRHLRRVASRSKARRLISQVGDQGRSLWTNFRAGRRPAGKAE